MGACACNVGLSNTGNPSCVPLQSVAKRVFVLPYRDNDGNINEVDCLDTFDQTYFEGKVNATDTSQRWFPLYGEVKNIEDLKGDSVFESFNDGANLFIQEGVRTFTGVMPNLTPEYLGQIKDMRCSEIGVFIVDADSNLIGNGKVDGKLYPIKVNNQTWNPILMKTTDTTVQKITLSFEYDRLERDEDIRMILGSEMTFDILGLNGLLDVVFKNYTVSAANDEVTFDLETIFGSQCSKVIVQGLELADFSMTVNGVSETIVSVTENPAGSYTLATTTDLVGGEVVVTTIAKNGLEALSGNSGTAA